MKRAILAFIFICSLAWASSFAYAKEITILFSGETHAMLYPCNCPKEADGGVARRAALIKQIKTQHPEALLLDSGNFFAGGLNDEYTQNTQLDKKRTEINLRAMELMGYDAAAIGDAEFNFGKDFLLEITNKIKLPYLSCNINSDKSTPLHPAGVTGFTPYVIKEAAGIKIGIIGVTNPSAAQKAGGLKFTDSKIALAAQVAELKKKGVNLIVLLSNLNELDNLNLINNVKGIAILIGDISKDGPFVKIVDTFAVKPTWQGRRLDKISFSVDENKVTDFKTEDLRLSDELKDDAQVLSILPACFSNGNCKKNGLEGQCLNPGESNASCVFGEANKIRLLVITASKCRVCNTKEVVDSLKKHFPGMDTSYLYYPGRKAQRLIKDSGITALPAYLFSLEIGQDKKFVNFKESLEKKGGHYLLTPAASGVAFFTDRKEVKGKFDLFLSLFTKESGQVLEAAKEFNPALHFLAVQKDGKFECAGGNIEVEEYLRAVCVNRYYPSKFWGYISCRAQNINSSWWEDCAAGIDTGKIKTCARGAEARSLLRENIAMNKEIGVLFGPVYMVDNKEIFSSKGVPAKEELNKIMRK